MNYLQYVNIKQGTKSSRRFSQGNTSALVQRPFGFASFTLQTDSTRGPWFYHPEDHSLEGIRLTHQPSPWIGEHGAIVMQPQIEIPRGNTWTRWSGIDPKAVTLEPHYMNVFLKRSRCVFELTPTEYGALVELDFERESDKYFSVLPVKGECSYQYDAETNRLYVSTDGNDLDKFDDGVLKAYFVFQFDEDTVDSEKTLIGNVKEDTSEPGIATTGENTCIHLYLKKQKVEVKLATSFISCEQALQNLKNDSTYADFAQLKEENAALWNSYLSKIEVEGDAAKMKAFYSCMYRAFLFPHKAYELDVEGKPIHFAPCDGTVKNGYRYTDNGFWDTYRTVYPFFSIVAPKECAEMLEGFIQDYKDGGWLPCWTAGDAKNCMPSTAMDIVIADAAVKGILSGELLETAFAGMERNANEKSPKAAYGREGVAEYLQLNYVPYDKCKESVNLTLDAAYCDYCLAVVADILGYEDKKEKYLARAKNYKNIFDAKTGFMRAKDTQGNFNPDFDPIKWGGDYTEAAAWQTTFAVQHDIEGLAALYGGREGLVKKLDEFFAAPVDYRVGGYGFEIHEMTEMAACDWGQCAISNQPSFHIPFMYAYLGEKEKADYWLAKICAEGFSGEDDGYPGDEDNGTTAIWYIFTQIGLYPICPGKAEYVKTTPLVSNIKMLGKELVLQGDDMMISHENLMAQLQNKLS